MNEINLTDEEVAIALCRIDDSDFMFVRRFMENAGFDLRQNGIQARAWCLSQAEAGNQSAQFAMAKLYYVGLWGEENKREALRWCQKSVESGFLPAKRMLSAFHEQGMAGLEPDLKRAVNLRQEAAEQGDVSSMRSLATDFLLGTIGRKDRSLALMWLRRAAEIGDARSQYLLAVELFKEGDAESAAEGVAWIKSAAEQNYPAAHFQIGHYYWQGSNGFDQDKSKASYHLDLAARFEEENCASLGRP